MKSIQGIDVISWAICWAIGILLGFILGIHSVERRFNNHVLLETKTILIKCKNESTRKIQLPACEGTLPEKK